MALIDRTRTAVLVMDFQQDILAMLGEGGTKPVERAVEVLAAARAASLPVIYVVVGFRPGYPEVSPRNASFSMLQQSRRFLTDKPGADIHPSVAPRPEDVVVVKHRVGAFLGTDLDMILRSRSIDTLVLMGFSTSGVVLSTLRYAADADYRIVVVKDACADREDEVHNVLCDKVFARQATVLSASALVAELGEKG